MRLFIHNHFESIIVANLAAIVMTVTACVLYAGARFIVYFGG